MHTKAVFYLQAGLIGVRRLEAGCERWRDVHVVGRNLKWREETPRGASRRYRWRNRIQDVATRTQHDGDERHRIITASRRQQEC